MRNKNEKILLNRDNRKRTIYISVVNKRFSSKSPVDYLNRQETEEGQREQQMKHCDNDEKDEINNPSHGPCIE